ncbi:nucleotide exchange factor GrpE [Candidatus Peregrinibacteria bacterium]|jgi:molecular chaperone GrpE|nr:nucleotide exchange factor GrpE [Candidatus Peregrinibacteria bacterium]MBT4632092.1 nucleotide exchange factor GrpE [Candidatus Peregrinibacteria bacterium]MBT5516606.1 nucleotide exchange factor GrpE [Candidatus Peregrinibacteria bacterium]MBT5823510.1 nucleotide exchange factor GrpE [Candidatus Peregrinibacteria bacterium]
MTDDNTQDQTQDDSTNELDQIREELEQMTETAKRALADLQNFKRHSEEQRAELGIFANIQLLNALFPTIDNFSRAFEHVPEEIAEHDFIKSMRTVQESFMQTLKNLGLQPIDQTEIPVDPNMHEVLMEGEGPAGQVIQIFEIGYSFNGKTVRPAKVQVGKA